MPDQLSFSFSPPFPPPPFFLPPFPRPASSGILRWPGDDLVKGGALSPFFLSPSPPHRRSAASQRANVTRNLLFLFFFSFLPFSPRSDVIAMATCEGCLSSLSPPFSFFLLPLPFPPSRSLVAAKNFQSVNFPFSLPLPFRSGRGRRRRREEGTWIILPPFFSFLPHQVSHRRRRCEKRSSPFPFLPSLPPVQKIEKGKGIPPSPPPLPFFFLPFLSPLPSSR